jgi:hypothetical protein
VRRLILLFAVMGCAQLGAPPGGPEDKAAPHLLRISPDTNALSARPKSIQLQFDEIINERPSGGGGDLGGLFLLSPRRGRVDVRWHRSRIEVRPRRGFVPNTTYTLTQLRGLSDLRGNADSVERHYMFSTGATRAPTTIRAQVFDWVAGRAAPRAYVEAVQLPDSLTYATFADSLGRAVFRYVAPGRYLIRALVDANSNRVIDRRELFDSATITVRDSVARELLAFIHDSVGPGIQSVDQRDSLTLRVTFDRPLSPRLGVQQRQFTLKAADSSAVQIASVLVGSAFEKAEADSARARAVRDSVRQAQIADSIRRANPAAAPPVRPPTAAPPLGRRPAPDTTTPPPKPSAPIPETYAVVRLAQPLAPAASFRLRADSLLSLMGIYRSSDRVFTTPKARAPGDTTRPPGDTARPPRRPPGLERADRAIQSLFTSRRTSGQPASLGGASRVTTAQRSAEQRHP